jgi:hypothetical protein
MSIPNPLVHFGAGRTTSPCAPLSSNIDVRIKSVDANNPVLTEKKKYFIQLTIRNAGTAIANACFAQLWWSPANVTGSVQQLCTGSLFGPPAPAQSAVFTVNGLSTRVLPDLVWDVPNLAFGAGSQGAYKLIAKVYYPGVNGAPATGPNPNLAPECDPYCGVRAVTILGAV